VRWDFARYIYGGTGSLALLDGSSCSFAVSAPKLSVPSWVPSFEPLVIRPKDQEILHRQDNLLISEDGTRLTVDGVFLSAIVPDNVSFKPTDQKAKSLHFYQRTLRASADRRGITRRKARREFWDLMENRWGIRWDSMEQFWEDSERDDHTAGLVKIISQWFNQYNYRALEDGRVVYAWGGTQVLEGINILAALKGSTCYTILRETRRGRYQCAGSALMLQDLGIPPKAYTLSPDFFDSRKVERITLV
jgi:hypothetical protein